MKKLLHHPLIVAFIACLIFTPIGSYIYDHTKNIPILTDYILKPISSVWNFIILIISYKISIGALLLTVIIVVSLLILIDKVFYSSKSVPVNVPPKVPQPSDAPAKPIAALSQLHEPKFLNYKRDNIKNWIWTWEYKEYHDGYRVENLKAHCPTDDTTLIVDGYNFTCPRCDKNWLRPFINEGNANVQIHKITVLIADNIRKKHNVTINV